MINPAERSSQRNTVRFRRFPRISQRKKGKKRTGITRDAIYVESERPSANPDAKKSPGREVRKPRRRKKNAADARSGRRIARKPIREKVTCQNETARRKVASIANNSARPDP